MAELLTVRPLFNYPGLRCVK